MPLPKSICVFCGSQTGTDPVYVEAAEELGRQLAKSQIQLVFGGGHIGLMGVVADAVLAHGGEVTGVIPESLQQLELAHPQVEDMRIVDSMHTRKALMAELSEGFIALPGGLGTFEELFEILTWAQLGFHNKPIALLNLNDYYSPLIQLMDRSVREGFMKPANRRLLNVVETVDDLMKVFANTEAHRTDDQAIREKT